MYISILLFITSFLIVGFGQPAWSSLCGMIAATVGFALFFKFLLSISSPRHRFWIGTLWFAGIQLIQLSWMISHPFLYIYPLYFFLSLAMGLQFGVLSVFVQAAHLSLRWLLGLSGLWVIMEWARLFFLSGFSFNPIGLSLSSTIYSLQFASIWGIYGLSFWVMFTNLIGLKTLSRPRLLPLWIIIAATPYLFGMFHLQKHTQLANKQNKEFYNAVLVQTSFPVEECLNLKDSKHMIAYVLNEWRQILKITKKNLGKEIDLLVLPEGVVPYGTYSCVYPSVVVVKAFKEILGPNSVSLLPPLQEPFASEVKTGETSIWMVNNAFWAQAMANVFNSEVIAGLEDAEDVEGGREYYSSAIHFKPLDPNDINFQPSRYEKRVLVPMGEYIPFTFLSKIAEKYGVYGSFTPGKEAKVIQGKKALGVSICYEETYGHLMRENKQKGAELLINLTSDVWYPNSRLVKQHFDHARLRTVENGIPLLRACNTGITAGLDSLGRIVDQLGKDQTNVESISDSLLIEIPTYTYPTVYSYVGDGLIIGLSLLAMIGCLGFDIFKACRK